MESRYQVNDASRGKGNCWALVDSLHGTVLDIFNGDALEPGYQALLVRCAELNDQEDQKTRAEALDEMFRDLKQAGE